jgi:hypothetical protein
MREIRDFEDASPPARFGPIFPVTERASLDESLIMTDFPGEITYLSI